MRPIRRSSGVCRARRDVSRRWSWAASATPAQQETAAKLRSEIQQLEQAVSTRSAEYRAASSVATLRDIQEALPDGAVLIEFAAYRPFDVHKARSRDLRRSSIRRIRHGEERHHRECRPRRRVADRSERADVPWCAGQPCESGRQPHGPCVVSSADSTHRGVRPERRPDLHLTRWSAESHSIRGARLVRTTNSSCRATRSCT